MWQQNIVFRPATECFPLNSWSWVKGKPALDCSGTYTETQYLYRIWSGNTLLRAIQFPQIRLSVTPILDSIGLLPPRQNSSEYPAQSTVEGSSGVTEYDVGVHRGCYFHLDATTSATPTVYVKAQRAYFRTDLGTALYCGSTEYIDVGSLGTAGEPYNGYSTTWEVASEALVPEDYVDIALRVERADALTWLCNDNVVSSSLLANTNLTGANFKIYLDQTVAEIYLSNLGNVVNFPLAFPNDAGSHTARATVNFGYLSALARL